MISLKQTPACLQGAALATGGTGLSSGGGGEGNGRKC